MPTYRDTGVILQKYELGEADILLTILLQDGGLTRAVANGARRQASRKRGHVEVFNQVQCLLAEGRNLDTLVEAESVDIFDNWRQDLSRISLAYYAADLTLLLLPENEPHAMVYQQLVQLLAWLGYAQNPSVLARWYEVQLLHHLGYWSSSHLDSQSQNAVGLLDSFSLLPAEQVAVLKVTPELEKELERLMRVECMAVVERESRAQKFVDQIREMDARALL